MKGFLLFSISLLITKVIYSSVFFVVRKFAKHQHDETCQHRYQCCGPRKFGQWKMLTFICLFAIIYELFKKVDFPL
jgi:hypothetical protein